MKRLAVPLILLMFCAVARADEIRLKDGSKIVGTIVGYESDAFKVETAYGFAFVRKASIAEIIPAEAKTPQDKSPDSAIPASGESSGASSASSGTLTPASLAVPPAPANAKAAHSEAPKKIAPVTPAPPSLPTPVLTIAAMARPALPTPSAANPLAATPAATSAKAAPAPPLVVQESVRGNLYINRTYGFQMYKPPDWELVGDAGKALPNAIAALGTADQTTLLVIGRNPLRDAANSQGSTDSATGSPTRASATATSAIPAGQAAAPIVSGSDTLSALAATTEKALRGIYDNYRPLPAKHVLVSGLPAIEQPFRGTLDDHDWSVVSLTFARGQDVFTILGMTYADSELMQIQENVIARTVASLQFVEP